MFFSRTDCLTAVESFLSLCRCLNVEPFPEIAGMDVSGVAVLRLDRIHPVLSGNKLFKLLCHWQPWQASRQPGWITPGGVWSNHLHAVAFLGQRLGIPTTGLIRGYEHLPLTATLQDCADWGMQLVFLSKVEYRQRYHQAWQRHWSRVTDSYFMGEGGALLTARETLAVLENGKDPGGQAFDELARVCSRYDQVWLAVGSGTTAAHLLPRLPPHVVLMAVNTVADDGAMERRWQQEFADRQWQLVASAARRFGAQSDVLRERILAFDQQGLPLDPVYGVALVETFLQQRSLWQGKSVLLIHGGGLQGRRGIGLDIDC